MVQFEEERRKEKAFKEKLKKERNDKREHDLTNNFQSAEVIRQQERGLKQAQFFYKQLRAMQLKEERE